MSNRQLWRVLLISLLVTVGLQPICAQAETKADIDRQVDDRLRKLYERIPAAKELAKNAKGILVFPTVVKAGFLGGGQYGGGGALRKGGVSVAYYNTVAGSYGLQAGIQSFGYALFFMNDKALRHLDQSGGFELGVGPSVVVVDSGTAKTLTTTTAKDDIYEFIFDQKGLMAGAGIQGSKITRIYPD